MSRSVVRSHIPLVLCFIPLLSLPGQQRRAFEPGGPESMVKAGSVRQVRSEIREDVSGMTIDADGKAVVKKDKYTVKVPLFEVQLFVDEVGVRAALLPLAGEQLDGRQLEGKFQESVRRGAFPKLLVFRFSAPLKAREIRENISSELRKYPGGSGSEAGRFIGYLRKDVVVGDEVEIRIGPDGTVRTTVGGESQKEIVSPEFADAMLSAWLMMSTGSVYMLKSFMPPKPGS